VQIEVFAVVDQRCAFEAGVLAGLQPELAGFGDGRAGAVGGVGAGADLSGDAIRIRIGVALALKVLVPALSAAVDVVHDPCLADLTLRTRPLSLAY